MIDVELGEIGLRLSRRTVDESYRLHDLESLIQEISSRFDRCTTRRRGVLEDGNRHRGLDRADQPSPRAVVFCLFADRECLQVPSPLGSNDRGRDRDRIGTHGHATDCGGTRMQHREHGLPHESSPCAVECCLPAVDVPVGYRTAAQRERTVRAQRMGSEVIDEGLTGHGTIVLVPGAESATRETG